MARSLEKKQMLPLLWCTAWQYKWLAHQADGLIISSPVVPIKSFFAPLKESVVSCDNPDKSVNSVE